MSESVQAGRRLSEAATPAEALGPNTFIPVVDPDQAGPIDPAFPGRGPGGWTFRAPLADVMGEAAETTEAIEALETGLASTPGPVHNVRAFGATGDGTTDDADAFAAAIAAVPESGGTVYLPDGDYLLGPGWTGELPARRLTIRGESAGGVKLIGSGSSGLKPTASIEVRNLTLSGFVAAIDLDDLDAEARLVVEDCGVEDCTHAARWTIVAEGGRLVDSAIRRCRFASLSGEAVNLQGPIDGLDFSGNAIDGAFGRGIQVGKNLTENPLDHQDQWQNINVSNNQFRDITHLTDTTSVMAVIVYGWKATIHGNRFDGVMGATSQEVNCIFTKCRYTSITGNVISGSGNSVGASWGINVKGTPDGEDPAANQGFNVTVAGNVVRAGGTIGVGIRVQNDDVIVIGNTVERPKTNGVQISGLSYNTLIKSNILIGDHAEFPASIGITNLSNGASVALDGNHIRGFGTAINFGAGDTPENLSVFGNQISDCRAYGVRAQFSASLRNLAITGNQISTVGSNTGPAAGIRLDPSGSASSVLIVDNQIDGVNPTSGAVGDGIIIGPTAGGSIAGLTVSGNQIGDVNPTGLGRGIRITGTGTIADATVTGNRLQGIKDAPILFSTEPAILVLRNNPGHDEETPYALPADAVTIGDGQFRAAAGGVGIHATPTPSPTDASQFTAASSQHLSIASNSDLQGGNVDWTAGVWAYLDSKGTNRVLLAKRASGNSGDYAIYYDSGPDRFRMLIASGSATQFGVAASAGSPTVGAWHFVLAWHDAAAGTLSIQVDGGPVDADPTTITPATSTAAFRLGAWLNTPAAFHNGRLQRAFLTKRVLTEAERDYLYNAGRGRSYGEIGQAGTAGADLLTGLVSWWGLGESSGTRNDSHGSNHLTDNNGVSGASGVPGPGGLAVAGGIEMFSPDGTRWRLTVDDAGEPVFTEVV